MFLLIAVSCVVMAMEKPGMSAALAERLAVVDYCLAALFTAECILKVIALSFKRYVEERTNQLDLFIVVTTLVEMALAEWWAGDLKVVKSLRILRALRPLRALTKSSGMRVVLKSVSLSLAAMVWPHIYCPPWTPNPRS
jgi:hypothetical protein